MWTWSWAFLVKGNKNIMSAVIIVQYTTLN